MAGGLFTRRTLAAWTFYVVFFGFVWLVFTAVGLGTAAPDATAVGIDFAWLYPLLLGLVPVVGLMLYAMKRQG